MIKFLVTRYEDGSIVDFGKLKHDDVPKFVLDGLRRVGVTSITLGLNNGTRVRYEQ